jgi:hypothetical protein
MKEYINPTTENVQMTLDKIKAFAAEKNFTVKGDLTLTGELTFPSENQKKVLRNYVTRLSLKMTRSQANRFLHALKRYTTNFSARVELSSKELAIQKARKEWKDMRDKAEQLLKAYKEEKGDFYK